MPVVIDHRNIAFGGAIELDDLGNVEPLLEGGPDFGTQAVAGNCADLVIAFVGRERGVQQIAAKLADILKQGRLVFVESSQNSETENLRLHDDAIRRW